MVKKCICFFGIARSYLQTYPYLFKNLITNNDLDVFICTTSYDNKKVRFGVKNEYLNNQKTMEKNFLKIFGNRLKGLYFFNPNNQSINHQRRLSVQYLRLNKTFFV